VSYPIESTDKTCFVQAVLATSQSDVLFLEGKGFAPNTAVALDSVSAGEHQSASFSSNGKGELFTAMFPFVKDKDRGVVDIHVSTPNCNLKLSVPWGKDSYHVE
jgi:hypothetical protein